MIFNYIQVFFLKNELKILFLIILLINIFTLKSFANDSAIDGVGETLTLLKSEHNEIQMLSEEIKMDIYEQYYEVSATFNFKNQSNKIVKTKMGFPETGIGDVFNKSPKNTSSFLTFTTIVNNIRTEAKREEVSIAEEGFYKFYWVKEVVFKPNESLVVSVFYRAKMGYGVGDEKRIRAFSEYNFTGGNWKNKVNKSTLIAISHLPKYYTIFPEASSKDIRIKDNTFFYEKNNWEAEDSFILSFWLPNEKRAFLNTNTFGKYPKTAINNLLTKDIDKLSCANLWVMRNEIFARYGKEFNDKEVKSYFEKQSWYRINKFYNDALLSEIEVKNIKAILEEEKKNNCF